MPAPWNRPTPLGLAANVALFVAVTAALNGVIFGLGWGISDGLPTPEQGGWLPPGWVVGAVWVVLLALLAAARWVLLRSAHPRAASARGWIVGLFLWCIAYPLYGLAPGIPALGFAGNVLTLVLVPIVLAKVWPASRLAAGLAAPVFPWVLFATAALGHDLGWLETRAGGVSP